LYLGGSLARWNAVRYASLMAIDRDQVHALVEQPIEALQVELKTWIDPRTDDGAAKLVKAIFAIRNRNGGFVLIGFDNKTSRPDKYPFDEPVEALFHIDAIQTLVSRYSIPAFEIEVAFQERDGQAHPVISIPDGVRVPAVIKKDLTGDGGKRHLIQGDLYFRTLGSNGTASSARIMPSDYADLLDVCFENREADIGRFLRRHLSGGVAVDTFISALGGESAALVLRKRAMAVIDEGTAASELAIKAAATPEQRALIEPALTMRVGLVLDPSRPEELPTQEFLSKVAASNPNLTGWPMWLDSRNFTDAEFRPYVKDGLWQATINHLEGGWSQHFDFLRFDPKGAFYLQRVMQDDLTDKVAPGSALDAQLMIYRVAEAFVVGTSMGRALNWDESAEAGFAFRWTGLQNRKLRPWVNAFHSFGTSGGQSHTPSVDSFVQVPLETPNAALAPYVAKAVAPLFSAFNGYSPPADLVETSVRKLIERKMDG
jgi:hypothetical protein